MFNRRELKGHKKAVLSVDASYEGGGGRSLIVSGSEDCTARIWDIRTNRAAKCFAGCFNDNPVDSVLFAVKSAGQTPMELLCASGSDVLLFDLRKDGVVDRCPQAVVRFTPSAAATGGEEEEDCDINCLSLHPKGHVVAAALDDGSIRLIDLTRIRERCNRQSANTIPATAAAGGAGGAGGAAGAAGAGGNTNAQPTVLPQQPFITDCTSVLGWNNRGRTHAHSNVASAVCFRSSPPSSTELVSGSFDCCVQLWDQGTHRRKNTYAFTGEEEFSAAADNHGNNGNNSALSGGIGKEAASLGPMINPPFVYTCAYACAGRAVLCGTGNGCLNILQSSTLLPLHRAEAHAGFVSCVHVPTDGEGGGWLLDANATASGQSNSYNDAATCAVGHIAFTGGNDKMVHAWRIIEAPRQPKTAKGKGAKAPGSAGAGAGAGGSENHMSLQSLWTMEHGQKINALTSLAGANVRQANTSVFSATSRFGLNAIGATPLASAATNTAAADNDEGAGGSGNSNANNSSDADFALVVADTSSDLFIYTYS